MYIHTGQYTCICQAKGREEGEGAFGTAVLWVGCHSQNLYLLALFMLRNLYLDWDPHLSFHLSIKATGLAAKEYYGHTTKGTA